MKMRINYIICRILALSSFLFYAGCASKIERKDLCDENYITNICFTNETEFMIEDWEGKDTLRRFKDQPELDDLYGAFAAPMDLLSGYSYYFFPDGSFAIDFWCDICTPRPVATGKWVMHSNAIEISDLNPERALQWFERYLGKDGKLRLFVVPDGKFIGDTILVSDQNLSRSKQIGWNFLRRTEYYRDWQKFKKERFEQKIFRMPSDPEPMLQAE